MTTEAGGGLPGPASAALVGRSFGLGVASGGRSTVGPAAVAATSGHGGGPPPGRVLSGARAKKVTGVLLLAELIADKLPSTPPRTVLPVLASRIVAGSLASWALAQRHRAAPGRPIAAGAVGAVLGSLTGLRWREAAAERGVPDLPAALLEDGLVLGLAAACVRSSRDTTSPPA